VALRFPISRDPPEGGTAEDHFGMGLEELLELFPISRDPPEGRTLCHHWVTEEELLFPISRDPPEGGTVDNLLKIEGILVSFQFLGIPPKGEHYGYQNLLHCSDQVSNF